MEKIDYQLGDPVGRARLGLIALQSDETIEVEFRSLIPPDIALYVSRIESGSEVTSETLAAMEAALPRAVSLLPPSINFDAIGYGCTSGTTIIGKDRVHGLIAGAAVTAGCHDPLSAVIDACGVLGLTRIGFVTPYVAEVSAAMRDRLEAADLTIAAAASFEEAEEARVARITPGAIKDAIRHVAHGVEGVFVSCTNLRALGIVAEMEAETGLPILTSNLALGWHMLRGAGIVDKRPAFGRLMET